MNKLLNTERHFRIIKEGKDNYLSGRPYKNPYTYLGPNQQVFAALYKQGWDEAGQIKTNSDKSG